ncbi:T6SS effector BTH_I2691 family protein [Providencia sp.]|uniref:T6SS effector BTH_I2691 family protein n=1 Tax=Providencia sp. TaxID=589 RepID=UPI003342693D
MSQMNKRQGCKFCTRTGLPILPVRPAIMSQHDILPLLPDNIHVPVPAQGETAYTLRLMRSGYLNIWDEFGKAWINYFVTEGGFYYPLPENGDVPDDVASGKIKPCIDQPAELAKASLVTLPMMPQGMKNGLFWFAWSEVKWTPAVRKQFEQQTHREQYMQPFDMDTWLNSQQASQSLPLEQLENTVAEYHQHARKSQMRGWSTTLSSRAVDGLITLSYQLASRLTPTASGQQIETTANQELHPNGAMIVLQDPTGILKDLSTLIEFELNKNVYKRPDIERQVMLYASIDSLEKGMKRQFKLNYDSNTQLGEKYIQNDPRTLLFTLKEPAQRTWYSELREDQLENKTQEFWADYQKYYDTNKLEAFKTTFNDILKEYDSRIVSPRTELYLNWFRSPIFTHYFTTHFDSNDLFSCLAYTSTINYCITNMLNKKGTLDFFNESLFKPLTDTSNILGRALAINHEQLIQKINTSTSQSIDYISLPWNGLVDAVNEVIEKSNPAAQSVIGLYLANISAAITGSINKTLTSKKVFDFIVALGIFQNRALIPVTQHAEDKYFIKAIVKVLMSINSSGVKPNKDSIENEVKKILSRRKKLGFSDDEKRILTYFIDTDPKNLEKINQLSAKEKAQELSKLMLSSTEAKAHSLDKWQTKITSGTGKNITLMGGGILSVILQSAAVLTAADFGNKKTLSDEQLEENSKFYGGVAGIISGLFSVVETGVQGFLQQNSVLNTSVLKRLKGAEAFSNLAKKGLGLMAGVVAVAFDAYHTFDSWNKDHTGLMFAYGISTLADMWLIYVIFAATLGPVGLAITLFAVIAAIGTAIYIAVEGQDNLQKWLERCLWRYEPKERPKSTLPEIYPTMEMELNELKRALG